MRILKTIWQAGVTLVQQARLLPRSFLIAIKLRRRQVARDEFEAERLDRIRNPSKYRGR